MAVGIDAKVRLLAQLIDPLLAGLDAAAEMEEASGDDLFDFFALAMAALIDHDTRLVTAAELRFGVEGAGQRIGRHLAALRDVQARTGKSVFGCIVEHGDLPIVTPPLAAHVAI